MNTLRAFSILFLVLLACSPQKKEDEQQFLLADEKALFRRVNMGEGPEKVRASEKAEPVLLSDTLMHFKDQIKLDESEVNLDIYYTFDEFGLFEIQADYFVRDPFRDSLFKKINTQLTAAYGKPSKRFESYRWTTPSASNTLIEISLSKERDLEDIPFISLNYLEPLNEEL